MPADVVDWLRTVNRALEVSTATEPAALANRAQRVLLPGLADVDAEGLFRIYSYGPPQQRVSRKPEVPGVVQWMQVGSAAEIDAMPASVGAFLTVALDRRVEVVPEVGLQQEGRPETLFVGYADVIDPRLASPVGRFVDETCLPLAEGLLGLPEAESDVISRAMQLHYAAVLICESDLAAAYTLVVAGLETLTELVPRSQDWLSWDAAQHWDKLFEQQSLSTAQRSAIRVALMKDKHIRLRQTFAEFVVESVPQDFWSESFDHYAYVIEGDRYVEGTWETSGPMAGLLTNDRTQLVKRLKLTYDARSRHVHSGVARSYIEQAFWMMPSASAAHLPIPFAALRSMLRWIIIARIRDSSPAEILLRNVRAPE
jgi:hypothetical protein